MVVIRPVLVPLFCECFTACVDVLNRPQRVMRHLRDHNAPKHVFRRGLSPLLSLALSVRVVHRCGAYLVSSSCSSYTSDLRSASVICDGGGEVRRALDVSWLCSLSVGLPDEHALPCPYSYFVSLPLPAWCHVKWCTRYKSAQPARSWRAASSCVTLYLSTRTVSSSSAATLRLPSSRFAVRLEDLLCHIVYRASLATAAVVACLGSSSPPRRPPQAGRQTGRPASSAFSLPDLTWICGSRAALIRRIGL